jgi:hypothetical protein
MRNSVVVLAATVLLAVSACGGGGTEAAKQAATDSTVTAPTIASVPSTTATSATSVTIPDGVYSRVIARADALAAGFDPALVDKELGADGRLPLDIKILGGQYTVFEFNDAGVSDVGDLGTSSYDSEGHWVIISKSSGCTGCIDVTGWSLVNGVLTLTLVNQQGSSEDLERLIVQGSWEKAP